MFSQKSPRMQSPVEERRMMRRFDMRLPAIVRLEVESKGAQSPGVQKSDFQKPGVQRPEAQNKNDQNEFQTETQNVSARGVFFYLDRPVEPGTHCEVTLTFPPHITLTDAVRVRFTARVIRVESPLPSLRIGTAAMIEDYEFLRSNGGDFFSALQGRGSGAAN
jgi:hypothetical protein